MPQPAQRPRFVPDSTEPPALVRLPLTTAHAPTPAPHAALSRTLTPAIIRRVITDFYTACRDHPILGPIFNHHVHDWEAHLDRIHDFWCSAILKTATYSGRPLEAHRTIPNLANEHFTIWLRLFSQAVGAHCTHDEASVFMTLAGRMAQHLKSYTAPA